MLGPNLCTSLNLDISLVVSISLLFSKTLFLRFLKVNGVTLVSENAQNPATLTWPA